MATNAPLRARIQIKDDGPQSFTTYGRTLTKGSAVTSANASEIRHFLSCGCVDITILSGSLDARPAASGKAPPAVDQPEEPAPEPEEQDGGTEAAGEGEPEPAEEPEEPAPEGEEPEEPEEPAEGETAVPAYARAELEGMSKAALIQRATADQLDVRLTLNMSKVAIIDAMMSAVVATPAQE